MILSPKQAVALNNEHRTFGLIGGVASGKTTTGSHFAIKKIYQLPQLPGLIFSNSTKQLHTSTLKVFKETLIGYGLKPDQHFVVNHNPKPFFGYESKFEDHNGIWSFRNGAQVMTFSLDSMMAGIEVGWAWGDEAQDAQKENLEVVYARLRAGKYPQFLMTMTRPRYNKYIDDITCGEKPIPQIVITTYDNEQNLPEGFIDHLKQTYDRITFDRDVMAKRVSAVRNRWVHAVNDEKVMAKIFTKGLEYIKTLPVYISFDFNKDPMTCLATQRWAGKIRHIREFRLQDSNIRTMCEQIKHYYGLRNYYVTGDASGGWSENPLQDKYSTYYETISKLLQIHPNNFNVPSKNPFHQTSRLQVNAICENHPDILIDEVNCPYLKDDILYIEAKEDGTINKHKDKRAGHILDCWRQDLYVYEQDFLSEDDRPNYQDINRND